MRKRFVIGLLLFILLFTYVSPRVQASAGMPPARSVTILANGAMLIEGECVVNHMRGQTLTASKPYYYRNANGVTEWTATITATFSYDGSTSSCSASSCTTSVQHGNWSESANSSSYAGNAAFANVIMVRKLLFIVVQTENINLSLTCDANGNVS